MSHILKPVIVCLIAIAALSLMVTHTNRTTADWTDEELNYALKTATQDATSVMMSDYSFFGEDREAEDFDVDLVRASEQFKRSFYANIGSTLNPDFVNGMNITLSGYVGYRYVYGVYGNGSKTIPYGYTYSTPTTMYEFTLGDKVYTTDIASGAESELDLKSLTPHYFSASASNENFRNMVVMNAVNNFLNTFYAEDANVTAMNAGTGVRFELASIDYAEDDPSVMTRISSIVDGPSFFAIVDINDTHIDRVVRVMSIGAAELKYTAG